MKIIELDRLEAVARDWATRAYRTEKERIAFLMGILAVVDTQDGITSDDIKRINTKLTYIIWHDGEGDA